MNLISVNYKQNKIETLLKKRYLSCSQTYLPYVYAHCYETSYPTFTQVLSKVPAFCAKNCVAFCNIKHYTQYSNRK